MHIHNNMYNRMHKNNNHMHKNNKTGEDNLEKIKATISKHFAFCYLSQYNRTYIIINK